MHTKRYIILLQSILMTLAFVSCDGQDDDPQPPTDTQQPLKFALSRADDVEENESFVVWCDMTYRDIAENINKRYQVLSKYKVNYETDFWYYNDIRFNNVDQTLKFWNNEAVRYNFDAVSPYIADANIDYQNYTLTIPGVKANTSDAVDWLVASHCRNFSATPITDEDLLEYSFSGLHAYTMPENYYDIVDLCFHHVLSQLDFRFYKQCYDIAEVTISSLTITMEGTDAIKTVGDYSSLAPHWINLSTPEQLIGSLSGAEAPVASWDINTVDDPRTIATNSAYTVLEIPQNVKDKKFRVDVTTSDGQSYTGQFTFTRNWAPGKRYVLYFEIPYDDIEIILCDVSVSDFLGTDSIDIDEPLVNW